MSERGVFAVDRGIFTDGRFADEPLTEREAFLWLVAEAAWKHRRVRSGATAVELSRGQLCHSVRFMAEAWRWSKSRVDRFLSKLEGWDTIIRTGGTATSVITVCAYDEIQRVSLPERDNGGAAAGQQRDSLSQIIGTADETISDCEVSEIQGAPLKERDSSGTAPAPDAGQQRDKLESIKTQISSLSEAAPSDDRLELGAEKQKALPSEATVKPKPEAKKRKRIVYPEPFERLWSAFPTDENMSKQEALKAWQKLDAEDCDALLASVGPFKVWIAKQRDYRTIHLERYIKYRRFDGFAPKTGDKARPAASNPVAAFSPDRWRDEVRNWQSRGGHWPLGRLTAPPDDPRTLVPRPILDELGIPRPDARIGDLLGGAR